MTLPPKLRRPFPQVVLGAALVLVLAGAGSLQASGRGSFAVSTLSPAAGSSVTGQVPWEAGVSGGHAKKVEFLIDGKLRWTERKAPYLLNGGTWDTTQETDGQHTLTLLAEAANGATASTEIVVTVENRVEFSVMALSPSAGQTVGGQIRWEAGIEGGTPEKVEFLIDGKLRWTERNSPYVFNGNDGVWDTTAEAPGVHTLALRAIAANGQEATSAITVTVSNETAPKSPDSAPPGAPTDLTKTGATEETLGLAWTASTDDVGVAGYGVYLNGVLVASVQQASYSFTGLSCGLEYQIAVDAYDAAGNRSAKASLKAATSACPTSGGSGASFYLAPSGSDSNPCTQSAPCRSFTRAYDVARQGDEIEVAGGVYGDQLVSGRSKGTTDVDESNVVFRPAAGATVRVQRLEIRVSHIEVRGMAIDYVKMVYDSRSPATVAASDIVLDGIDAYQAQITSARLVTIRNSDFGPSQAPDGDPDGGDSFKLYAYPSYDGHEPRDILFENVAFHGAQTNLSNSADHVDCFQSNGATRVTMRNVRIYDCLHGSFLAKADQGPIDQWLIENSSFFSGKYWQYVAYTGKPAGNLTLRFSSFVGVAPVFNTSSSSSVALGGTNLTYGNILKAVPSNGCSKNSADVNVVWTWNVFESGSCGFSAYTIPDGNADYESRADDGRGNAHIKSVSEAIDRGHPTLFPSVDMDGDARPQGPAPDAGGHEGA